MRCCDSDGFTLIELVVVAALLALLATILYGTLSGVLAGRSLVEARRDAHRIAEFALDRIGKDLTARSITPLNADNLDNERQQQLASTLGTAGLPSFLGSDKQSEDSDDDRIRFVTENAGQASYGGTSNIGLVEVEYHLEKEGVAAGERKSGSEQATKVLLRDEVPSSVQNKDLLKAKRILVPIAHNILSLNFRYRKDGKWQSTWQDRLGNLPEAVEVTLKLRVDDEETETFRTSFAVSQQRPAQRTGVVN